MNFKARYQITADNSQAKRAFQEIDQLQKKGRGGGSSGGGIGDVFGGNLAADAVSRLTSKLYEGGTAVFDYTSKVEQARIAFGTLIGNQATANKHIEDLMRLSRQTPLDFLGIAKVSQRLQGAGVQLEGMTDLIKDIGNIAAATGELTEERLEGIGVAISQVFTKGKVSAEEMEQLSERGVPAWQILSRQLNKTTGEVRKLAEEGKITSQQFIDAFQKFSRMNYGDAMERQAATFSGAMGKITNILLQTANTAFQPLYDKIARFADDVADSLSEQEAKAGQAGISFGEALGEGIGKGLRRSGGLDLESLIWSYYPGAIALRLGWDLAKGFDQGFNSYDSTMLDPSGRRMKLDPKTFTMVPADIDKPGIKAPPPGAYNPDADKAAKKAQQEAERRRREAERLAERDLQAAIRIEEMNFETILELSGENLDEMRRLLKDKGFGGLVGFSNEAVAALNQFKTNIKTSIEFLEELENKTRSGMTVHEKALLDAAQAERRQKEQLYRDEETLKNTRAIEDVFINLGELAIARYQREKDIADEVERQAAAFREVRQSMLLMPGYDANGVENMSPAVSPPGFSDGLFGEGGLGIIRDEAMEVGQIYNDLGMMVGDTIGQMIDGVGSLVEAWVLYGDLGPQAVRKMTASILAGLAAQAAVKAIFQLAEGFAALFFNPAEAAAHFKAAALYGAVAVGAGLAGRAIAGDAFKNEGGSGSSSSSAGSSRASSSSLTPISRQSETTFMSGRNPWQQANDRMVQVLDEFQRKISSMPADHVVTMGAKKASGAIAAATVDGMRKNATHATNMRRTMGT